MEVTRHYDNMTGRWQIVAELEGQGLRMLHDDFDEDWEVGDEPHGTLTFTDEEPTQAPSPEPIPLFEPPPEVSKKVDYIEQFLKRLYG